MSVSKSAFVAGLFFWIHALALAAPPAREEAISIKVSDARHNAVAQQKVQALRERIRRHGDVLVLLELRSVENNRYAEGIAPSTSAVAQEISEFRQHMQSVAKDQFRIKRAMPSLPMVSMYLREQALDAILASRHVHRLFTVGAVQPALAETTVQVGSRAANQLGYSGSGTAIAVIDTGIARFHPFLAGKVVHERCFGSNGTIAGETYTSNCTGGAESAGGPGSAEPCDTMLLCAHGTHIAGIAAGALAGTELRGVAPGANIIFVKAFSTVVTPTQQTTLKAADDDIVEALQHVYSLRNNHQIAAVNMSFGGGRYSEHCDADSAKTSSIQLLRGAGILSVAASGNNSFTAEMLEPACVSSVIAVGAVTDNDVITGISNAAEMLDLFAPGESVYSAATMNDASGPTYLNADGTSVAAPHVAGAIAVLRGQRPSWTATQIENRLKAVGPLITDNRNGGGVARRRLDVESAVRLPERPVLQAAFNRCEGDSSIYNVSWREGNSVAVTTWDVDISQNNVSWSDWFNGAAESQSLSFNGGTRHVRARGYNNTGWGEFATVSVSDVCNPPPAPLVQKAFLQCNFGHSIFQISWNESGNVPVATWDVDIASTASGPWADLYSGSGTSRQISFDGGTRHVRVRGSNVSGWSMFSSISATDTCTGSGNDPDPKSR